MICPKCGTKNLEDDIFCINCGASLAGKQETPPPPAASKRSPLEGLGSTSDAAPTPQAPSTVSTTKTPKTQAEPITDAPPPPPPQATVPPPLAPTDAAPVPPRSNTKPLVVCGVVVIGLLLIICIIGVVYMYKTGVIGHPAVTSPSGPSAPSPAPPVQSQCNVYVHGASGYLTGPGDSCTITINTKKNYLEVPFTYPKGKVDFWVKVEDPEGYRSLGNFDLDNGDVVQLSGGGLFKLIIYSKAGAGNWSATW